MGSSITARDVLNFLNSSRFRFLSAVMKAVRRRSLFFNPECAPELRLSEFVLIFNFPARNVLETNLETPAWLFSGDTFFGTRDVHVV